MGVISVRVMPRSSNAGVEVRDGRVVVRVRAAPVDGKATEEARRRLADALAVPPSRVRLRSGAAARDKAFEVDGMGSEEAVERLGAGD